MLIQGEDGILDSRGELPSLSNPSLPLVGMLEVMSFVEMFLGDDEVLVWVRPEARAP